MRAEKVKQLRLERGWSQETLAKLSGLNIRTIQRVEKGKKAGLETLNALAAVFDVERNQLFEELSFSGDTTSADERRTLQYVEGIKGFYIHLFVYFFVLSIFLVINLLDSPSELWVHLPALTWGAGILFHGLFAYEVFGFMRPEWVDNRIANRADKSKARRGASSSKSEGGLDQED